MGITERRARNMAPSALGHERIGLTTTDNAISARMRHPYHGINCTFDLGDLQSGDPIKQFEEWFEDARKVKDIHEANAMALATATKTGVPSVRMVLLKGYDADGFRFFTNYNSRKAVELAENPRCSLMFYWEPIKRSVRIEGCAERLPEADSLEYFDSRPKASKIGAIVSNQSTVINNREVTIEGSASKLSEKDSTEYFQSRPKDSQIGACVSKQSSVIESRQVLTERNNELQEKYKDVDKIPKPDYWGGYLIKPDVFEFWQGQTNRLHDRIRYRKLQPDEKFDEKLMHKGEGDWIIERLSS